MLPNVLSMSPLIWTGLLSLMVALPVLIHLINMLRHRRVKWAAMDFLLVSHSRNRNWVWLRQLLLLMSRIAMLLVILLMIAQIGCHNDDLAQLESRQTIHHYVLLDDSFSMGERNAGQRLFDRALNTLQVLGTRIGVRQNQRMSLLRFSEAQLALARLSDADDSESDNTYRVADIYDLPANSELVERIQQQQTEIEISDLSVTAEAGLDLIDRWIRDRPHESAVVYVVSDFRQQDWSKATPLQEVTRRLAAEGTRLHFINCARSTSGNLTLTRLEPVHGMHIAGVPTFMRLSVQNQSGETARSVQVRLQQTEYPARNSDRFEPGEWTAIPTELPTVLFDEIEPGQEATQQFPIHFPSDGFHVVTALLQDDPLPNDNQRDCVIDCRPGVNLLIVEDGSASQAYYLQSAFQPGRRRTGFTTSQRSYAEFQRMSFDELSAFDAIAMLAPQRFSSDAIQRLRDYVRTGGGLTIYLGPDSDTAFLNASLHEGGDGLVPIPLDSLVELDERLDESVADIIPMPNGLFRAFADAQTSLLDLVTLKQYYRPPAGWEPDPENRIEVLARVRTLDGDPLIVTRPYGDGATCLVTTSCAPDWNDWSANPTFVVSTLLLQESLVRNNYARLNREVGDVLEQNLGKSEGNPQIRVAPPSTPKQLIDTTAIEMDTGNKVLRIGEPSQVPWSAATASAGVYSAWLTSATERISVFRWSTFVDADEGKLAKASSESLLREFAVARPRLEFWDEISSDARRDFSSSLANWFLILALAILILEQALAYFTSFHPTRRRIQS